MGLQVSDGKEDTSEAVYEKKEETWKEISENTVLGGKMLMERHFL